MRSLRRRFYCLASVVLLSMWWSVVSAEAQTDIPSSRSTERASALAAEWEKLPTAEAIDLFLLAANEAKNNDNTLAFVSNLVEAAQLTLNQADFARTKSLLRQSLAAAKKAGHFEVAAISAALLAFVSNENNSMVDSDRYSREAQQLSRLSKTDRAVAYANFSRGIFEYYFETMRNATDSFARSASFAKSTDDEFITVRSHIYLGFAQIRNGDSSSAMQNMEIALNFAEKLKCKKGRVVAHFGIGAAYYVNEKQKALTSFKLAESLLPTDFDWMENSRIMNAIGNIYLDLGEYLLAEDYFKKAIKTFDKAAYNLGKVTSLTLLAESQINGGNVTEALQTYQEALHQALPTNDKFRVALIIEGLGNVALAQSDYDRAIKHFVEAKRTYDAAGVKLPYVDNLLASTFLAKGDYQKAKFHYQKAADENRRIRDILQLSESLYGLSKTELKLDHYEAALKFIAESVEITESVTTEMSSAQLKRTYISNVFERFQLYINILMKLNQKETGLGYDVKALQIVERSRARGLVESLSSNVDSAPADKNGTAPKREREYRELLNAKADRLTELLRTTPDSDEVDDLNLSMNEIRHRLDEVKAELRASLPQITNLREPSPFDLSAFQANVLDDETAVLEYSFGPDESHLFLVTKSEFKTFILPPRSTIREIKERLLPGLRDQKIREGETVEEFQSRIAEAHRQFSTAAGELGRILFGTVAERITGKRVILIFDSELNDFPVGALPIQAETHAVPLMETNEVVYAPSSQSLIYLSAKTPGAFRGMKDFLIFSDPVFTRNDPRLQPTAAIAEQPASLSGEERNRFFQSLDNLARLAGTGEESAAIVDILHSADGEYFSGFQATRQKLLDSSTGDFRILHFATHGITYETRPELNGLVLSRFDEQVAPIDAFVRIQDIHAMNLNADLVVLSACETGIGRNIRGEGLMSLNNAFLQSGAKTVVSSLWKVDDDATLELMKHFYAALINERLTPAAALRKAQLKLRENPRYSSPFYWAAFTVNGDFKNVPQISRAYSWWIYSLPAAALIVGLMIFVRRRFIQRQNHN